MRRSRAAAVLAAGVLSVTAPVLGHASPAHAEVSCESGTTRYVDTPSYPLARLGIGLSWPLATGEGVTVAVVDSGVEAGNAHLEEAVVPGRSFVPGDSDPTGRTDIWRHGTAVAGIIGARAVEDSAVVGVAPDATIVPVRVYAQESTDGFVATAGERPELDRMAAGIAWAVERGVDVINVSMSSRASSPALERAIAEAVRRDIVVVASGGNRPVEETEDGPRYPAALPGVIGVAATDTADRVTDYSIHGEHIDVAAPGQDVLTTFLDNGDCLVGTDNAYSSYATAFVSGLAALLREEYPRASGEEIAYRIMAGADRPRRDQRDDLRGWGLVQPLESLTMTLDPTRPGPRLEGWEDVSPSAGGQAAPRLTTSDDPLAERRQALVWWVLLGGGFVAIALIVRPLAAHASRQTVVTGARDAREGPRVRRPRLRPARRRPGSTGRAARRAAVR